MLAGPSPEALIGPIAAATSRIRVGSGGVMLPHYSPFKVAETFSLLAGLFPGRIDLGLGRAAGTDQLTTFALQRDRRHAAPDDFPNSSSSCSAISMTGCRPSIRLRGWRRRCRAIPSVPSRGCWAPRSRARCGPPISACRMRSQTSSTRAGAEIAALYRERFAEREHERCAAAHRGRDVWVICADSDEEALRLSASGRMTFTLLRRGDLIAVPPPEEALRFLEADERDAAPAAL